MIIFLIWIAVLLLAVTLYYRRIYSRFTDFGVLQPMPFPLFGNMLKVTLRMEHLSAHMDSIYYNYPSESVRSEHCINMGTDRTYDLWDTVQQLWKLRCLRSLDAHLDKSNRFYEQFIYLSGESISYENPSKCSNRYMDIFQYLIPQPNISFQLWFVGRFEYTIPCVLIRDLELVKKITIKDFEHFLDHRDLLDDKIEPLFARNLFSLKGQEWKDMRSTLSPAFTSSKIKQMVPFMEEVGEMMIRAMKKKVMHSKNGLVEIDCKDLTSRYANDVIASCAFGLKVDSHTNEDNKFYERGKNATTFKLKQMLLIFFYTAFPSLAKAFKLTLFSKEKSDFFIDLVQSTMKNREKHNIIRPDMIHLLMEAKKGGLMHEVDVTNGKFDADIGFATVEESDVGKKTTHTAWSDNDLTAQVVLFFIAALETTSTMMSFTLYELAVHPDVQERLFDEIREHSVQYDKLDFTSIQQLNYLDMVVSEVLRLWPTGLRLDRICVKDYNMGKPNKEATNDFIIRKGELLMVPTWSIHRDPQFFPNPNKFDPERFSNEKRHLINLIAYMPFGLGPRNCIGSRFALCELKMMIYQIILNFEILPTMETCIPAKVCSDTFNLRLKGGHGLQFKSR